MIDGRAQDFSHVELFCITCSKRWELHRDSASAKIFHRLERKRRLGLRCLL